MFWLCMLLFMTRVCVCVYAHGVNCHAAILKKMLNVGNAVVVAEIVVYF